MATYSSRSVARHALEPAMARGWCRGFANLFHKEQSMWWGTRRWLVHLLVWVAVLNGLILFLNLNDAPDPDDLEALKDMYQEGIKIFFELTGIATGIGVLITAQSAIVGEKQLGTAAWVLSKPVSRSAFVLAKFVSHAIALLSLAILVPHIVLYGQSMLLWGRVPPLVPFLASCAVMALHLLFYLALTLMLGTLWSNRSPLAGIVLGFLIGGGLLGHLAPQLALLFPWNLWAVAASLALGAPQPAAAPIALAATMIWTALWLAVALWRFGREEF